MSEHLEPFSTNFFQLFFFNYDVDQSETILHLTETDRKQKSYIDKVWQLNYPHSCYDIPLATAWCFAVAWQVVQVRSQALVNLEMHSFRSSVKA